MSRRDAVALPALNGPNYLARSLGFRRCYRRPNLFHGIGNLHCNCLRVELPVEAQAKSSGRLATPERNHGCPDCGGLGEVSIYPCQVCGGTGELTAAGARTEGALSQSLPPRADRAIRRRLTSARDAGLVGAVEKRGTR